MKKCRFSRFRRLQASQDNLRPKSRIVRTNEAQFSQPFATAAFAIVDEFVASDVDHDVATAGALTNIALFLNLTLKCVHRRKSTTIHPKGKRLMAEQRPNPGF